jgi:ATP-dependent RNA helicase DHX37/DHR1
MTAEGAEEHVEAEIDRLRSLVAEAGNLRGDGGIVATSNASTSSSSVASTEKIYLKMKRLTPESSGAVGTQVGDRSQEEAEMDRIRTLLRESMDHLREHSSSSSSSPEVPLRASSTMISLDSSEVEKSVLIHSAALVSACTAERSTEGSTTTTISCDLEAVSAIQPLRNASSSTSLVRAGTDGSSTNESLLDEAVFGKSSDRHLFDSAADEENPLILVGRKKQKKKDGSAEVTKRVELTPLERKHAIKASKNAARKLAQLERRASQKAKRAELYRQLQETSLPATQLLLLSSSSTLGGYRTAKQQLGWLVQKERAGLHLTDEEHSLLYRDRGGSIDGDDAPEQHVLQGAPASMSNPSFTDEGALQKSSTSSAEKTAAGRSSRPSAPPAQPSHTIHSIEDDAVRSVNRVPTTTAAADTTSYASQLMASLLSLKTATVSTMAVKTTTSTNASTILSEPSVTAPDPNSEEASNVSNDGGAFEAPLAKKKRYLPPEPTVLKTAAAMGFSSRSTALNGASRSSPVQKVVDIQRPPDIQATRYDLPVSTMEFEVMDAIRNHDVTILCSETGSGKSTQVPQFLYEYGFASEGTMIGVTQPRRVAAVSTAKRVAYEIGSSDGKVIASRPMKFGVGERDCVGTGNVIAYQTRYEAAGLGSRTRIKFMTDGLLLQEIQSDLLLRKYSVIVLDEAHERNLNTDVLIGLVSKALVLRKQAKQEGTLPGLKLVMMSATLRVEDFTGSGLFETPPVVVRIPGRAHPVTIHHSKVTEMDNYCTYMAYDAPYCLVTAASREGFPGCSLVLRLPVPAFCATVDAAFQKICKMHRKLPPGGILVFLTSKQEILRMVNRLRKVLAKKYPIRCATIDAMEIIEPGSRTFEENIVPRDLDDEEVDADLMFSNEMADDENDASHLEEKFYSENEGIQPAYVLPLYSLLSTAEQSRVFSPPPDGHRLIVVATNVAETSITIPGISYVVDSGRQKCRNHHATTGMSSYDIMWISKASADQRAGRAGRTGPGHCYRLYSSSMYVNHMDAFTMPEVLLRPLEDVVLAMKAMDIASVLEFPFPTPPDRNQLQPALELLANLGCINLSSCHDNTNDGVITRLGSAIAKLPLGVRYGKMLLVAAQAGVLDYAVAMIAALSEPSPFLLSHEVNDVISIDSQPEEKSNTEEVNDSRKKRACNRWHHGGGDVLAAMIAVGAYAYAGRGAGGSSGKLTYEKFCAENGLNFVIMSRAHTLRRHIARLVKARLRGCDGVAARTGDFATSMPPPNKLHELLLRQSLLSGLLDNVAMLAPFGSISGEYESSYTLRTAYLSCSRKQMEPLFLDRSSVLFSRDPRRLPQWVCFDSLERKANNKDALPVAIMKRVTPIDPAWLGELALGSKLLSLGEPLEIPRPMYDAQRDQVLCSVATRFGCHGWEVPPLKKAMGQALADLSSLGRSSIHYCVGDEYRWFARYLLEGKVLPRLEPLPAMLNDEPSLLTRKVTAKKAVLFAAALQSEGVCTSRALRRHWATVDDKFLFRYLKLWTKADRERDVQRLWIAAVRQSVIEYSASP